MLRPVEVHVTPAVYATLKGATGAAGAAGATGAQGPVGPLMWANLTADVVVTASENAMVMPMWNVPSTGSYTVHLLNSVGTPDGVLLTPVQGNSQFPLLDLTP
jgi:hypothetical protein